MFDKTNIEGYNEYSLVKTTAKAIVFTAKRSVWLQMMISIIICAVLIAMNILQNSFAVLYQPLCGFTKRFSAFRYHMFIIML